MLQASASAAANAPFIVIHGAREHNLKNLSLAIPRNRLVVVTGVSGSGKSTLAFDILFAEGQRRFLDSMNTYARQFVDQMPRPDVDLITGLPPTVSIEQRTTRGGGKSTVATVTEIYHFLRLLFARLGIPHCPRCQAPVQPQTPDRLAGQLQAEARQRGPLQLLAPVVRHRKGFHTDVAAWAAQQGFPQIRADGLLQPSGQRLRLDRFREHNVDIVVGTLENRARGSFREVIDRALQLGHGTVFALDARGRQTIHSTERVCPDCGESFEPLDPKHFSYNSPRGWCPKCRGFGELFYLPEVDRGARAEDIEESWFDWQEGQRELCPDCQGARLNPLARAVRLPVEIPALAAADNGRTRPVKGAHRHAKAPFPTIDLFAQMPVSVAETVFGRLRFEGRAAIIARDILPEIRERLKFLNAVGLGYLQLGRGVTTLSGGESQRIRLAAQLGSNLHGVLYVLDEPTIGLHARDNQQLLAALAKLRERGNSLVVVEHDEETMRQADYIVDLGPGAGIEGGRLVASGTLKELLRHRDSITGQCLRQKRKFPQRGARRPINLKAGPAGIEPGVFSPVLELQHARKNNLKDLTVRFPLQRLVVVTGVSGSGKSTLVRECLLPAMRARLAAQHTPASGDLPMNQVGRSCRSAPKSGRRSSTALPPAGSWAVSMAPNPGDRLSGGETIRAVYEVDQSPIGRTPRSVPATYVGFFDEIRRLFAQVPESRVRGYSPSRFSFNSAQGRCPACEGAGVIKLTMSFLPPAFVRCETCAASRFNRETLDIQWRGKNIAQVLEFTVAEALDFFKAIPKIRHPLEALRDTGLGYVKLGQTSPTLSGGEAQRLKLVTHLLSGFKGRSATRPVASPEAAADHGALPGSGSLFLLEEPTIGLHIADVRRLVEVLHRLVDAGHSVIVIEHNLDLIAEADWVIDLGPEGGDGGGRLVAAGTPEILAQNQHSHTGRFLRKFLKAL